MTLLSEDAIARGLEAAGVPPEKARAEAKRQHAQYVHVAGTPPNPPATLTTTPTTDAYFTAAPAIAWPVRILIPWSHLVSDNERKEPYLVHVDGKPAARMRLSRKYAAALERIQQLARNKVGDAAAVAMPLAIRGLVWVPDERPHDVANFEKLVHDALEGPLYTNDRWLHDIHWTRAGVDVDAPRAEITITPIPA